jgi:hypothetical protein
VLAIGCDRRVPTAAGSMRPDTHAASLPKGAWQRLSAGPGAKGQRYDEWAWVTLTAQVGHHWHRTPQRPRRRTPGIAPRPRKNSSKALNSRRVNSGLLSTSS